MGLRALDVTKNSFYRRLLGSKIKRPFRCPVVSILLTVVYRGIWTKSIKIVINKVTCPLELPSKIWGPDVPSPHKASVGALFDDGVRLSRHTIFPLNGIPWNTVM